MSSISSVSSILSAYYTNSTDSSTTSSDDTTETDSTTTLSTAEIIEISNSGRQLLTDALSASVGIDIDDSSDTTLDGLYSAINMKMNEDSIIAELEEYYSDSTEETDTTSTTDETDDTEEA